MIFKDFILIIETVDKYVYILPEFKTLLMLLKIDQSVIIEIFSRVATACYVKEFSS